MRLRNSSRANFSRFSALLLLAVLLSGPIPNICYGGEIHSAVEKRDVAKIKALVREKRSLLLEREDGAFGYTAIHVAAEYGYEDIVELLLELGAEVNTKARNGETALITAIGERYSKVATLLLSNGADVTIKSNDGNTALHLAAIEDLREIAEVLIAKGAEINAPDENGITPLHWATKFGSKKVATLLMGKGASLAAREFHSSAFGYSLDVPPGWEEIPRDLIQKTYADLLKPDSMVLYDAGFQLASSDHWFAHPFVLVQVTPSPRQINEDEFESFVQALTGMDFNKEIPTDTLRNLDNLEFGQVQLDADRRRYFSILNMDVKGVGPIRALSVGHFGRDSVVMIHSYSLRSDFDRDAEARLAIVDSFRFDPDKDYSVELAAANPSPPSFSQKVLFKGLVGAVTGAFFAMIVMLARRTRQKDAIPDGGRDFTPDGGRG